MTLEASLEDLQGRFNLNWLVIASGPDAGKPDPVAVAAFQHLCELLEVEPKWADMLVDWIDGTPVLSPDGAEDSAYLGPTRPIRREICSLPAPASCWPCRALDQNGTASWPLTSWRCHRDRPQLSVQPRAWCSMPSSPAAMSGAMTATDSRRTGPTQPRAIPPPTYRQSFDSPADYTKSRPSQAARLARGAVSGRDSNFFRLTSLVTIGTTEFDVLVFSIWTETGLFDSPIQRSFSPD